MNLAFGVYVCARLSDRDHRHVCTQYAMKGEGVYI